VRLLLDTHTLLWWLEELPQLSAAARQAVAEADQVYVSAASATEIAIKHRAGRLPNVAYLLGNFEGLLKEQGFRPLPITIAHGVRAGMMDFSHKDPFDRLLIAQAIIEDLTLVSNERLFDQTGVSRLW
jgi:PIN domain nuclease of toxin-antitoxin system